MTSQGVAMIIVDATIVNVSVPVIIRDLDISASPEDLPTRSHVEGDANANNCSSSRLQLIYRRGRQQPVWLLTCRSSRLRWRKHPCRPSA